ncbi:transcriptional regulator [Raphidocelis subcapitata]|uniref:Transcriptional regulator n=1 Tax=Raphidocelis subcapitata TaxID=307507 RepID=A0A2V0P205_9CHLO|nr:transcriptional regulator [Raphidocelis subcapitata]|eukprot:GBF93911.1 transcriptional regulator [Raphidocelis subcapitata]
MAQEALRGPPLPVEDVQAVIGAAMTGAMTLQMVFVGDKLGLYRALKQAGGPVTSAQLAAAAGLQERWVREWLHQQAAARLVECDREAAAFWMTRAQLDVLANEEGADASPYFSAGTAGGILNLGDHRDALLDCFRTGAGLSYDRHGPACAAGVKRELGVWTRHFLVEKVSSLPGLLPKLKAGAKVADVGCGAGLAICLLAAAFPKSEFHGYDISKHALELAVSDAAARGLPNAHFHDCSRPEGRLPAAPAFDFVLVNDALHDMTRPDQVLAALRGALQPDGLFLICDIASLGPPAANIEGHPMGACMYAFSVSCCLSSGLSEPGGLGLGTLGFHREVAERMAKEAGFSSFEPLDWESSMNAYYLVRP